MSSRLRCCLRLTDELITHAEFPDYQIRLKKPKICDSSVKQVSGLVTPFQLSKRAVLIRLVARYLDISDSKHLFFWAFESRDKVDEDPLVMWLNGGPGCSSSTGLLFELGPCNIVDNGENLSRTGIMPRRYLMTSRRQLD